MKDFPNIIVLATGGTIAGRADDCTQMTGYQAGAIGVESLLAAVPQIFKFAKVKGEQICDIDSCNMTEEIWFRLAKRINELLINDDVDGIVITHGTDTLEETAYFLNLVVKSEKPVVIVGAMRPATAISADGPLNLLNAIKLATSKKSMGKGILVAMNDEIYGARDVTKTNTENVAAFKAPGFGLLGYINNCEVELYHTVVRKHTIDTEFSVAGLTKLPQVEIVYAHANQNRLFIDAAVQAGAKGIVYAGMGNGSIHQNAEQGLVDATHKGVVIVRASRGNSGKVIASDVAWEEAGFIKADTLSPQKARILLSLALTKTNDKKEIQRIFNQY